MMMIPNHIYVQMDILLYHKGLHTKYEPTVANENEFWLVSISSPYPLPIGLPYLTSFSTIMNKCTILGFSLFVVDTKSVNWITMTFIWLFQLKIPYNPYEVGRVY